MAARPESESSVRRAPFFCWRKLRKDELDHELIWSATSAGSAVFGLMWLWSGKPLPSCAFHAVTGIPCPTCGTTRATLKLLQGDLVSAFLFNPLYTIALAAVVAFNIYAVIVLAGRLPRLRKGTLPRGFGRTFRWGVVVAILANWAWLIYQGI